MYRACTIVKSRCQCAWHVFLFSSSINLQLSVPVVESPSERSFLARACRVSCIATMDLDMEARAAPEASMAPEHVNVIFALGASVGLALGGCILFAVAYYHMPGFRRRRRARTTWSIPEQAEEEEEQSLHARVELLDQLTREWQAQLVESRDASGAELSEKLSEICGVVQGELAKEVATR